LEGWGGGGGETGNKKNSSNKGRSEIEAGELTRSLWGKQCWSVKPLPGHGAEMRCKMGRL